MADKPKRTAPPSKERGRRIREARRAHDWDQVYLALRLGVHRNTVSAWERGGRIGLGRVQPLADALGLDRHTLVQETDP